MFGTPVVAAFWLPVTDINIEKDPMVILPEMMRGSRQSLSVAVPGIQKISGTITAPVFPDAGMSFLAGAIGTDAVTGSGAPYTHTITPANVLPSFTIEKNMNGADIQYAGMIVSKAEYTLATKAAASSVYTFEGQKDAILGSPSSAAFPADIPFGPTGVAATIAAYSDLTISSLKCTIDNTGKPYPTFNGESYPDIVIGTTRKVTYEITAFLQSLSGGSPPNYYAELIACPSVAIDFTLAQGAASCVISSPACVLTKYADPVKLGDVVMVNLTYTAMLDPSSGQDIGAVVTNSHATAY